MWVKEALLLLSIMLYPSFFGCSGGEHDAPGKHSSVMERINQAVQPNNNAGLTSDRWLEGVEYESVKGMTLHGVDTFFVEKRTDKIGRFNCSECHTVPLAGMKLPEPGLVRAHWEIELHHASEQIMTCQTCHASNAMDSVQLLGGENISFNESYRLCAGCHSTQAADWVGGAHGKRRGSWALPRVVASCTSCHNPHDPGFKSRFPARASKVIEE